MATATSNTFPITSLAMLISDASGSSIQETTASITVSSNSTGGIVYIAVRTGSPYTTADAELIRSGIGAVYYSSGNKFVFGATGLKAGEGHYIGVFQEFDVSQSNIYVDGYFKTNSFPQEQLRPYQVSPYPDLHHYRDVPVHQALEYGWGPLTNPITFAINKLPEGLSMDTAGEVTGSPSTTGIITGIEVIATNIYGSTPGPQFSWGIDRLSGEVGGEDEGVPRSDLFDATLIFAERQDQDAIDSLPSMLVRANAKLSRELKARNMTDRYYENTIDGWVEYPLPPDYEGLENLQIIYEGGTTITPQFCTHEQANNRTEADGSYFTIENNRIRFAPATCDNGVIEFTYFRSIPYMDTSNSTNWLINRWFDIYHNAMMVEISIFTKDMEQTTIWKALLDESLDSANDKTNDERWTQPGLQIRTEVL